MAGASCSRTASMICGLTASTAISAPFTAAALSALVLTSRSCSSALRWLASGSSTLMLCGAVPPAISPPRSARPMWPPPTNVILMSFMASIVWANQRALPKKRGTAAASGLVTRAEQGGAHPHHGGAFGNGCFQVARHAGRKRIDSRTAFTTLDEQIMQAAKAPALFILAVLLFGNGHQPSQSQARAGGDEICQLANLVRAAGRRLRLILHLHLGNVVRAARAFGALVIQPPGDANTINGMHPVKMPGRCAGLV